MHDSHGVLAKWSFQSVAITGDFIVAGLRRYPTVWQKYFRQYKTLNKTEFGDRTQHSLWRFRRLSVLLSVKYVVVHCGPKNLDNDEPKAIANAITKIVKIIQQNSSDFNIIFTRPLPGNLL